MQAEGLSYEVVDERGNHLVLLRGELDVLNCESLERELDDIAHSTVIVDLSGLTFIDAAGINALVRLGRTLESRSDELVIVNASRWIRRVFELAGAARLLS